MSELLHSKIQQRFQQLFELESDYANVSDIVPDIPSYIQDNLHHNLRPYQEGGDPSIDLHAAIRCGRHVL